MPSETTNPPPPQLRVMQIIVVALAAGLASYLGFGLFTHQFAVKPVERGLSPLALIALLSLVPGIMVGYIVPSVMIKTALERIAKITKRNASTEGNPTAADEQRIVAKLLPIRVTALIIKLAALEVPGYAAAGAYFTDKDSVGLAIAAGVTVAILLHFPTASGLQKWLDRRAEELAKIV